MSNISNSSIPSHVSVGSRCVGCDGFYATIRYIGVVGNTPGVWLGVEWDDESRGKHDGTHNGQRYFTTAYPSSGSFIRAEKVKFGISILQAIQNRYGRIDDKMAGIDADDLYVTDKYNHITPVEFVGAEKVNLQQSKWEELREILLCDMEIVGLLPGETLRGTLQQLCEFDISKNLLSSWESLTAMAVDLPNLRQLNVSSNRLTITDCSSAAAAAARYFSKVHTLVMNKMNYDWCTTVACVRMFPKLLSLHVCFNNISTLRGLDNQLLQDLTFLSLASNPIGSWPEILHLGKLPRLEELIINDTGISEINFPDVGVGEKSFLFPHLRSLVVSNNCIDNWNSVNELDKLNNLRELRFRDNPLLAHLSPEDNRQRMISRIGRLVMCNRSPVTSQERRGAELDYLKQHGTEWLKAGGGGTNASKVSDEFTREHPRYMRLVNKYGAPEDGELKVHDSTLKGALLRVTISFPCDSSIASVNKKLPNSMSVQKVKTLVQRLCKRGIQDITLFHTSGAEDTREETLEMPLDIDLRPLSFYSINDGDNIIVKWQ